MYRILPDYVDEYHSTWCCERCMSPSKKKNFFGKVYDFSDAIMGSGKGTL